MEIVGIITGPRVIWQTAKHHHHHHNHCSHHTPDKDNNDNNDTRKQENRQKAANTAPMAYRMPHDRDRRVYIILHQDGMIVTILGVYEELQDANRDWGIDLLQESPTTGPDKHHLTPIEPARWDTPDGVSCWVESHTVEPSRFVSSNVQTRRANG
ncbi:hypothetical protein TrVFT333_002695 [Trichoderma virens FT-333]|nr:hypothetical protein TrVFT333_002695 [Trichoderma virens FT-333]